jgi:antagonist of KipI
VFPRYSREPSVRVMPGSHAAEFGDALYSGRFGVTSRSNRMGIRLDGPKLWPARAGELVSTAVAPGTIQVPPDGNPIVLMADAQTLGGYPRVAHVAAVDVPLLAQLAPGTGSGSRGRRSPSPMPFPTHGSTAWRSFARGSPRR